MPDNRGVRVIQGRLPGGWGRRASFLSRHLFLPSHNCLLSSFIVLWGYRHHHLSLLHSVWGSPLFDPMAEEWMPMILYEASGPLHVLTHKVTPAGEFQGTPTSCMLAHGSSWHLPQTRAETARLLRTWSHKSQNIMLFVKKTLKEFSSWLTGNIPD